ncbi:GAF and ANTAR domain-containing protein [Streptomyces arenae]|uniref:GAF and ANTAR domain-containing protein n=1 Tax=Streptomyces arenae TaxID=29301 RepID=UPI00265897A7|nr:GAF and ANTAR domain-containing protein [Streptomyces arenae]MCG7208930.1 GAF and ANTAR domain-containing protein [Streptomyces arenae]
MNREQQLTEALVSLADSFADDVDPVVLLDRLAANCAELTGAEAVGVMMAPLRGGLRTMAVTDDRAALLEFFQLQADEGPCVDCYRQGERVDALDLAGAGGGRWAVVGPLARAAGFGSAHALPLRVHQQTIGAVNLLVAQAGGLPEPELSLAQALADVTAVALVSWSPYPVRADDISSRVQAAIAAKATVEIAGGMIAEYGGLSVTQAQHVLRAYAVRSRERLTHVAHALVQRTLPPDTVLTTSS